jgi:hypothetical protein
LHPTYTATAYLVKCRVVASRSILFFPHVNKGVKRRRNLPKNQEMDRRSREQKERITLMLR